MSTLHYFYDPFCGWCYGAAPIISIADKIEGLTIQPHGIGMLSGNKSKMMSPEWRDFVRPHEERIHALSGQEFGEAYTAGIQERRDVLLDSSRPIAAMLAAQTQGGTGIPMLKRLQKAYYLEGLVITDLNVIANLAEELGYERQDFIEQYQNVLVAGVDAHIKDSHRSMAEAGKQGVPAFILEHKGEYHELPFGHFISRPEKITGAIKAILEN